MLGTSTMDPSMKVLWLERWNLSPNLRVHLRFPKPGFNVDVFFDWLHKATWWAQVRSMFSFPPYFMHLFIHVESPSISPIIFIFLTISSRHSPS